MKISKKRILNIANQILLNLNHDTKNMCKIINKEILQKIKNNTRKDLDEKVKLKKCYVVDSNDEKHGHFVGLISNEIYSNTNKKEGYVLVDAALKQFEDKLNEQVQEVVIVENKDKLNDMCYEFRESHILH